MPIIAIIDIKSAIGASGPNSGTNVVLFENAYSMIALGCPLAMPNKPHYLTQPYWFSYDSLWY